MSNGTGDYAALKYIGNCEWEPLTEPLLSDPPNELPTTSICWLGRSDKLTTFLATHPVGLAYLGGFIIGRSPREHSPGMHQCDITVALKPDLTAVLIANTTGLRTGQTSAEVSGTINDQGRFSGGSGKVQCERSVTYESPETRYTYFADRQPTGPRFFAVAINTQPRIIRSVITARGANREAIFAGLLAPAAIATALFMPVVDKPVHTAEPIPGTPWYRCTDTVTRELEGRA